MYPPTEALEYRRPGARSRYFGGQLCMRWRRDDGTMLPVRLAARGWMTGDRLLARVLVEERIGRSLLPGETMAYRDGNPMNLAADNVLIVIAERPVGRGRRAA